ncbi:hypothetical protein DPMN_184286 [Dreissena polymorpha]|uniref:Uncharacterized protein n=1 Tax=Dreissena polymorpha TaxID=45954 RepID=A0A9D4DIW3_DREPO|nr:hypothetical protein DPMN_184286 [Dreissena polymorpha]
MLRNIGNVACFIVVLMTSHHVTGQSHDVAQFNRRLTIIKNSVEYDIADIRLEVKELKMIVEQIVGGQSNTSDGSVIGQGMTDLNQREITDLKNKLNAHESRLNRLFSSVNEIQDENTALKNKVNQFFEEKENGVKTELLKLNAGIETKFDDIVNVLQIKFEETTAAMMKGYKDLKTHVNVKVSVVDQINNLAQSVISEQNKLSSRLDQAVKKLEVNELVEKRERKELINNLKAELLLLNAGVETKIDDRVNALQKRFEESTTANLAGYKYLETHMSVQMKNLTQSVISEQNKLSARMDQADAHIVRMKAKTDKCCIDCGDPTPDHGTVNTTATTFGTVVKIACNHGYVLSGANIAKCNADSVWSDSATCNPYDCGNASPANGVATAPKGTTYQKQAYVQCNPGYALNGSSLIECSAAGWNDSVQCVIQTMCDAKPDCSDGADELNCMRECFTDEYLVKNDSTLSVSSQWNQNETDMFGADQGRLNSTETGEGTSFRAGIWAAGVADTNQYIQVNFTSSKIITGIVTRGRPQSPKPQNAQWVKQYRFMYSRDCETFNTYTHTNGSDMLFDANDDGKTIRPNQLPCPVLALCARVNPTLWHGYISMQFDVRGCDGPI